MYIYRVDLLLASLDAARWSLAGGKKEGKRRLEEAVRITRAAREELSRVQGATVMFFSPSLSRTRGKFHLTCCVIFSTPRYPHPLESPASIPGQVFMWSI